MPASWIQSFNPFFVVILAAVMPGVWGALARRGMEPTSPTKQAIGLLLLSLGYLVICFGVKDVQPGVKVSLIWLTGLYFIHTMGEIALSPIGLSMVNKLTPVRFASLMMGIWYLSTATANKGQQVCRYALGPLSRSGKSKDPVGLPHRDDVRLLPGVRRHVGRRVAHPLPAIEEIAEDDARSGINSLPLHQFNNHKSHG